jgi:carboxyl-terminal processing protease
VRLVLSNGRRWWIVAAALAVAAAPLMGQPTTQVAVAPSPAAPAKMDAVKLRTVGIETALAGQFAQGLTQLREVAKDRPTDPIASEAVKLLESYMVVQDKAAKERMEEYNEAVERVGHINIAQEFMDKNDTAKAGKAAGTAATEAAAPKKEEGMAGKIKKLRGLIKELGMAYNQAGTSDALEDANDPKAAGEIKKQAVQSLTKVADALGRAAKCFEGDSGPFVDAFRAAAAKADRLVREHLKAWEAAVCDTRLGRRDAADKLKPIEYDESDALGDLESMTLEKPWRVGLIQARLACRLAPDKEKFAKEKWLTDLVAVTDARAKKLVQDAEWYDALSAYGALNELLPDNEAYDKAVKIVQRHVRVLSMYGRAPAATQTAKDKDKVKDKLKPGENPDNDGNGNGKDEEPEAPWREVVTGVDADMVEKVIAQLDLTYVASIDFRQVTEGGLTSLKVLAETPQATNSFPGLKDAAKKKQFIEAIDRQIADAEKRDHVTHLDLILALNSVLHASEQSVNIPTEVLCVEFTDGFLDELDKFSSMIWPYDVPNFEKQTMGHFFGVGVQITKEPGEPLKVTSPLVGTPAFRAGIKAGDLIVKVDGKATEKLSVDKLVNMIMGKENTTVVLTIKRGGLVKDYPIFRAQINIRTVKGWEQQPKTGEWEYGIDTTGVGYIRISQFTEQTDEHLVEALRALKQAGIRSIVLDLRFNPGGLLRSAAKVANEFLMSGRIVSTRGRRTRPTELEAGPDGKFLDGDIVVLVNQYSASAAEIVSGALKDWHRAKIIGQRSYGKGSVQNVIPIRRNSALLKLTTAYYYLPMGRLLHKKPGAKDWGVDPDVEVFLTNRQTRRWLDIRRKTDIVQEIDAKELKDDLTKQYESDVQLNTAVLMLKLMKLKNQSNAA